MTTTKKKAAKRKVPAQGKKSKMPWTVPNPTRLPLRDRVSWEYWYAYFEIYPPDDPLKSLARAYAFIHKEGHENELKNKAFFRTTQPEGTKSNRLKAEAIDKALKDEVKRLLDIKAMPNADLYFAIKPFSERHKAFESRKISSNTLQKKINQFAAAYRAVLKLKMDKSG